MNNSRRNFIRSTSTLIAGAGLTAALPASVKAFPFKGVAASDKLNIAAIGINGMGWTDLMAMLKHPAARCIALCDVDKNVLSKRMAALSQKRIKVKAYSDYRKLLDNKNIDAVIIGTPDHWHCLQMMAACAAGKEVYVEKPLGNSITECRNMVIAQQKYKRVVQVGQWQRSQQHFKDAIAFVHSGKLGKVRLVKTWAYVGWINAIPIKPDIMPPAGVNYHLWLGPAMQRPFNENRFHFNFRWFWDYAGGLMTDLGVHLLDYALLGMKASSPKAVIAAGGKLAYPDDAAETPDTMTVVYEFDGFNIQWEQATGIDNGPYNRDHGIAFIGNNGTLLLDRGGWEVIPEKGKMEAICRQRSLDNGLELHTRNFVEIARSHKLNNLNAPILVGAKVAIAAQMGNIAYRIGKKIHWDNSHCQFTDNDANKLLTAKYHNNYKLPDIM